MFKNFHFKLKYINFRLLLLVYALSAFGVVVIGSAAPGSGDNKKQFIGIILGTIIMFLIMILDYNKILKFHWIYYILSIVMLLAVLVAGRGANGAKRWIKITSSLSFQPSELTKVFMILFWAWLFGHNPDFLKKWKNFFITVLLTAIPLLLIVAEPDLSTTLLTITLFITALYFGGFSLKKFGIILSVLIPIVAAFIIYVEAVPPPKNLLLKEYQYNRVMAFLNPSEFDDARMQQDNSVMAIGSGKLNGKGLYNNSSDSVKNGNYIPEPQTDFIFAIIGEETGFVGSIIVIGIIALITVECVITGARAPDTSGKIICFGVAAIMIFQSFINIGVATELLPNTGIPLPFVSYGLSSLVTMYIATGLVLSVRFHKKVILEEVSDEYRINRA